MHPKIDRDKQTPARIDRDCVVNHAENSDQDRIPRHIGCLEIELAGSTAIVRYRIKTHDVRGEEEWDIYRRQRLLVIKRDWQAKDLPSLDLQLLRQVDPVDEWLRVGALVAAAQDQDQRQR